MNNNIILGIETSGILCSVAWWQNGSILLEYNAERKNEHAVILADFVDKGFKKLEIDPSETSYVAIGSGPGSFTGLRIGMSYAKGFCYGYNIPLIPITHFEILAQLVDDSALPVYTLIEAGKGRYFTGIFERDRTQPDEKDVYSVSELKDKIQDDGVIIIHEEISRGYFTQYFDKPVKITDGHYSAAIICEIGEKKSLKEPRISLNEIEPLYLQAFAGMT
jgi:tRNA threonylcarbamoyladenosine biosynthesis protein TsaB